MTPEAQQLAIAKACGYDAVAERQRLELCRRDDVNPGKSPIPDYLHNLDAMHEAEKTLTEAQCAVFAEILASKLECYPYEHGWYPGEGEVDWHALAKVVHATAEQRAEALLRAIGQWVEETESQHERPN